jgi:hypothetical protein
MISAKIIPSKYDEARDCIKNPITLEGSDACREKLKVPLSHGNY